VKILRRLFFIALAAGQGACISLRIDPVEVSENMLQDIQLCRGIEEKDNALLPLDITSKFETGQDVLCFVLIRNVSTETQISWRWYDAENQIVKETGPIAVNQGKQPLESISASDTLNTNLSLKTGRGAVAFFLNGKLAATKEYTVLRRNSPLSKTLGHQGLSGGHSAEPQDPQPFRP
jgi:hypothetical protein